MPDPHLKSTLERKCAETELRLVEYQKLVSETQTDLVHLNATIALFERDRRGLTRCAPTISIAGLFKRGELYERCFQLLGERGVEMDTSQLAEACLKERGLDPADKLVRRAVTQQIIQMLQVRKGEGIVSTGKRGVVRVWTLAKGPAQNGKAIVL